MIYGLDGVPGAGKTLYFVQKVIAERMKVRDIAGNLTPVHIFHNIEGFNNDVLACLTGLSPTIVNEFVHNLTDKENFQGEVVTDEKKSVQFFYARPESVHPVYNNKGELVDYKYELRPVGSIFIIDEAQNYFSSRDFKEAYSKTLIPYMTRHRHYYHSIWWASQKVDQVDITFRRNTEQIYFLENLASKALIGGLEKCQISVYESYLGIESGVPPLAKSVYAYDKRFYKCYKSHVCEISGLKENRQINNIWRASKGLKIVLALLLLFGGIIAYKFTCGQTLPQIAQKPITQATPAPTPQSAFGTIGGGAGDSSGVCYKRKYIADGRWVYLDSLGRRIKEKENIKECVK